MTNGRRVVELALQHLAEMSPALAREFRPRERFRYANAGRDLHWTLAAQNNHVSNRADDTCTPRKRIAAQMTVQMNNESSNVLAALKEHRRNVEHAMSRRLSWLDGGDNGSADRALVRSWRELEGDEDGLAVWLATEMLRLRAALRPYVVRLGYQIP